MAAAVAMPVIQAGVSYPLPVFMKLVNMGRHAIRAARRKGLDVRYVGNQGFVTGDAWLKYLEEHGEQSFRSQDA
jgi:hypothetical protein